MILYLTDKEVEFIKYLIMHSELAISPDAWEKYGFEGCIEQIQIKIEE